MNEKFSRRGGLAEYFTKARFASSTCQGYEKDKGLKYSPAFAKLMQKKEEKKRKRNTQKDIRGKKQQ